MNHNRQPIEKTASFRCYASRKQPENPACRPDQDRASVEEFLRTTHPSRTRRSARTRTNRKSRREHPRGKRRSSSPGISQPRRHPLHRTRHPQHRSRPTTDHSRSVTASTSVSAPRSPHGSPTRIATLLRRFPKLCPRCHSTNSTESRRRLVLRGRAEAPSSPDPPPNTNGP